MAVQPFLMAGAAGAGGFVTGRPAGRVYLTAYQIGLVGSVWEPFFSEGSTRVLRSWLSNVLPVPDAALGAFGYLLDLVTALIGGRDRWRSMPWMVILFGLAVGPLGAASILLVIAQPVIFDSWCHTVLGLGGYLTDDDRAVDG
jgi:uncharacterized membrane protein